MVNYYQAVTNLKSQGCHSAGAENPALPFSSPVDSPTTANPCGSQKTQTEEIPEQTQQPV